MLCNFSRTTGLKRQCLQQNLVTLVVNDCKISCCKTKSNISFLSRFNIHKMTGVVFIIVFGASFVLFPCQGRA